MDDEPYAVTAAVILNPDSQWIPFVDGINAALKGTTGDFEIKGGALFRRLRKPKDKNQKRQTERILKDLLALPERCAFPVFYEAADRREFESVKQQKRSPEEIENLTVLDLTFSRCLQRVNKYINSAFPKEKALWLADEGRTALHMKATVATRRFHEVFAEHLHKIHLGRAKRAGKSLAQLRGGAIPPIDIRLGRAGPSQQPENFPVIDTVYFGDSKDSRDSRALQFVDLCCYVITANLRCVFNGEPPTLASAYHCLISPSVANAGTPPFLTGQRPW